MNHDHEYWVKMQNYIHSLEQECHKIQAFKRELPLSLQLVTQAIDSYKHLLAANSDHHDLHLEEFIPIKTTSSSSFSSSSSSSFHDDEDDQECYQTTSNSKLDWLKSAHLSLGNDIDQTPDLPPTPKQPSEIENMKTKPTSNPNNNHNQKDDRRKSRRCWSPDLHTRFVDALQNLGGPHVATPKQIREVMKVDGLTNDEVKSHLQKYRLHTRRPIAAPNPIDNTNAQQPQFVIVGGMWVPQTISDSAMSSADGIYSPIPKLFASTSSFKLSSHDCRNGDHSSFAPPTNPFPNKAQPTTTLLLG